VQSPVLTGIELKAEGLEGVVIEPASIPDLFAQRPIVVTGKWQGPRTGRLVLTGHGGAADYQQEFDLLRSEPSEAAGALPILWARTRIGRLSDFGARNVDPEKKTEITELGLKYSLLTAYTSFVAVHEEVRNPGGQAQDVKQPLPLPQHVPNLAVGGDTRSVPEPGLGWLLALAALGFGTLSAIERLRGRPVAIRF